MRATEVWKKNGENPLVGIEKLEARRNTIL